jgi:chromosome partitioning protein
MSAKRKRRERAYVVAVAGIKGGSGKSTIAAHFAVEGCVQGLKVLAVDADEQASLATWAAVGVERSVEVRPQLVQMGETLRQDLFQVAQGFDLVVIDCPGQKPGAVGPARVCAAAYSVADFVLLPVAPGPTDVWTIQASVDAVEAVRALRPELQAGIVLNKLQNNGASRTLRDAVKGLDVPVLRTSLRLLETASNAIAAGQGVTVHKPSSPSSKEFIRLFKEVVKHA